MDLAKLQLLIKTIGNLLRYLWVFIKILRIFPDEIWMNWNEWWVSLFVTITEVNVNMSLSLDNKYSA